MIPRHWTVRYICDRLREWIFQKRNPDAPWLTPAAVQLLRILLAPEHRGLEFGSGRSTSWLAARCGSLISVEDNPVWYEQVQRRLSEQGLHNVDYRFAAGAGEQLAENYRTLLQGLPDHHFDFVLVDSEYHRDVLVNLVVPKLKPGGFLVVDNINWFLPSGSRSPHSRTEADGPAGSLWSAFARSVQDWRCTWTSSGVTDTAFFFKPNE